MPEFVKVANVSDIQEGHMKGVSAGGKEILVANVKGKFYAMDAICSHKGGPLPEGKLEEHTITCPWHEAKFDVRTGKAHKETNWATDLNSFEVKVVKGDVMVKLQYQDL